MGVSDSACRDLRLPPGTRVLASCAAGGSPGEGRDPSLVELLEEVSAQLEQIRELRAAGVEPKGYDLVSPYERRPLFTGASEQDCPPRRCGHPELVPYRFGEEKPPPAWVVYHCRCGANWSCPVCGFGAGSYPCRCRPAPTTLETRAQASSRSTADSPWAAASGSARSVDAP